MRECVILVAIGMLLAGCQTDAASANVVAASAGFETEATRLTEGHGDVVLVGTNGDSDRQVALVVRYVESAPTGGPLCTLFIVERSGTDALVVEKSGEFLACNNALGADLVKHALEARVESATIRLEEQHVRSHSTYEFTRSGDGRWHLTYGDHVGPESNPDGGDLLLVSHTVAYVEPTKGPTVSDFSRKAIGKDVVRSVIE